MRVGHEGTGRASGTLAAMEERTAPVIIAIDGPAGSGKSTLARGLARELGVPYVNTGSMYRSLTHRAMVEGIDPNDGPALRDLAARMRFDLDHRVVPPALVVDGRQPGEEIHSPQVEASVSAVSGHPAVREVLVSAQRRLGGAGAVMEGRDIGRVVFPQATLKVFLDARPEERAARRARERGADVAGPLARRDSLDARVNPPVPAEGAVVVDTSGRTAEQVLAEVLADVRSRIPGTPVSQTREAARTPAPADRPVVAVVGRQNVGKSTLVNRLLGRREAIADPLPGVTRDRIELTVEWRGRTFTVVDTGGFVAKAGGIEGLVADQARRAEQAADIIVLVVDARTGIQEEDASLAKRLRRATAPVVVVANKVDEAEQEPEAAVFHSLGLGEPMTVSALHGRGSGELLDRLFDLFPDAEPEAPPEGEPAFALVGRPNVGKSSLFNRLVGEDRSVVFEEAGTTRDAVDAVVEWEVGPVRFVDTAGLRRPARMQGVDYFGLVRASRAIDRAHVALVVLDASEGLTAEDKHVAARIVEAGRGLLVAANKWDLVPSEERSELLSWLGEELGPFCRPTVVRTSALTGVGVARLPKELMSVHGRWSSRAPTAEVNRVLQEAQADRPPPRGSPRFRYATQVSTGPPTFVLFGARAPDAGYRRFLENRFRSAFALQGVPIRLRFRPRQGTRRPAQTPGR